MANILDYIGLQEFVNQSALYYLLKGSSTNSLKLKGNSTGVIGEGGVLLGLSNTGNNNSSGDIISGNANTLTSGDNALLTGSNNTVGASNVLVGGSYNTVTSPNAIIGGSYVNDSGILLLALGNGTAQGSNNAFSINIFGDGVVGRSLAVGSNLAVSGSGSFSGEVVGIAPTHDSGFTTKKYVDDGLGTKQPVIDVDHKILSDLIDDANQTNLFVTSSEKSTWNGKQDEIDSEHKLNSDLVDDTNQTHLFVTSGEKSTWSGKQDLIDSEHMLSADLVDDSETTNLFVTSEEKSTWNGKQDALTFDEALSLTSANPIGNDLITESLRSSIICIINISTANTTVEFSNLNGMSSINWGDGTVDANLYHTYVSTGTYSCRIYGVTSVGDFAFSPYRNRDGNTWTPKVHGTGASRITSIYFTDEVHLSGIYIFATDNNTTNNATSQLTRIHLPNRLTTLPQNTFYGCKYLIHVTIPHSLVTIESYSLVDCVALKQIEIPETVATINQGAFQGCSGLEQIIFKGYTPPTCGSSVFTSTNSCKIYVPQQSLSTYKSASGFTGVASRIVANATTDYVDTGLNTKLSDPITGQSGAPTTSTVGEVGQEYITTGGTIYQCTAITAQGTTPETYSYTWKKIISETNIVTQGSGNTAGNAGVIKLKGAYYSGLFIEGGVLYTNPASANNIENKEGDKLHINPINVPYAVKRALTNPPTSNTTSYPNQVWTNANKAAACATLGAIPFRGHGTPTTSTVANYVGQTYVDMDTHLTYCCTAIDTSTSTYTWE